MENNIKLDVRVYPLDEPKGATLAFANVGIDDMVAISGIRVVQGEKGAFVTMPQSQDKDGNYHDIAFPVNGELRKEMNKAVLAEYNAPTKAEDGQYHGRSVSAKMNGERADSLDVRVFPIADPKSATLAFANVTFDNIVAISGVRVVNSDKGAFVTMPQSKDKEGGYHDIAFPINSDLRKELNKTVLAEFNSPTKDRQNDRSHFADSLAAGKEKAAAYVKSAPAQTAAKKAPGLGD
jgi:stage V sporulation protein G